MISFTPTIETVDVDYVFAMQAYLVNVRYVTTTVTNTSREGYIDSVWIGPRGS